MYQGIEVFYGDDGTLGRHVYDDEFTTANAPGWYWGLVEAHGGAFETDIKGPFNTRNEALINATT
jgi:hypothetical protein